MRIKDLGVGAPAQPQRPLFVPITAGKAFEEVAHQVRTLLQNGVLKAGDRLPPERILAVQFGINRNTIRQALRTLQTSGLLELRAGRNGGAYVRDGDGNAVLNALTDLTHLGVIQPEHLGEAQISLGIAVAKLAAKRRTAEDLANLEVNIANTKAAASAGDFAERARLGFEFQRLLALATRNPVMSVLTDAVIQLNAKLASRYGGPPDKMILTHRRRIYAHLQAKDSEAAAAERERFLRLLERYYVGRRKSQGTPGER